MPRVVFISGLPGVGKSTVSRELAKMTGAVWLRIDTIEAAIQASVLAPDDVADAGYRVAAEQARDLTAQGHEVIIDCVLGDALGRSVYGNLLEDALFVELTCDAATHEARVLARHASDPATPDWAMASSRVWEPWDRSRLPLETSQMSPTDAATRISERWK